MRYSIIIPYCHGAPFTALQRQELDSLAYRLDRCELLTSFSNCPTIEHAVVAGLRAARGEAVVVVEPGDRYPLTQLPIFLRALARADFVCGRRRRRGWPKLAERVVRLPRWLFLGLDARDPGCLFWAARREVFGGLQLLPRFVRHMPALVARQGFRVDSVYIDERPALRLAGGAAATNGPAGTPHVASAGLLSAWWACIKLRRAERTSTATTRNPNERATADFPIATANPTSEPYKAQSA